MKQGVDGQDANDRKGRWKDRKGKGAKGAMVAVKRGDKLDTYTGAAFERGGDPITQLEIPGAVTSDMVRKALESLARIEVAIGAQCVELATQKELIKETAPYKAIQEIKAEIEDLRASRETEFALMREYLAGQMLIDEAKEGDGTGTGETETGTDHDATDTDTNTDTGEV